jgi:hypothetical protein
MFLLHTIRTNKKADEEKEKEKVNTRGRRLN